MSTVQFDRSDPGKFVGTQCMPLLAEPVDAGGADGDNTVGVGAFGALMPQLRGDPAAECGIVLRPENTGGLGYRGRSPHGEAATMSRKVSPLPLTSSCTCAGNESGGAFTGSAAVPWAIRLVIA